ADSRHIWRECGRIIRVLRCDAGSILTVVRLHELGIGRFNGFFRRLGLGGSEAERRDSDDQQTMLESHFILPCSGL
ncbi:hypothetical protein, partial [Mesorhizobium sp. M4B.F.Ca.ET.169.01.1.1]|uniref:hypothetical protein n=1 Tax=Mesorhizobium sp. M4B.F.Ca.ET.169.01.1.1 TaxID=2563949 RepID=UPI001AEE0876